MTEQTSPSTLACAHSGCGKAFTTKRKWGRFCSALCRRSDHQAKHDAEVIRQYLVANARKGGLARAKKIAAPKIRIINSIDPGMLSQYLSTPSGEKAIVNILQRDAARAQPVAWRYMVNGVHVEYSGKRPPDDAYDEGSLQPLYAHPRI